MCKKTLNLPAAAGTGAAQGMHLHLEQIHDGSINA
jgi:hypothetical protein